MGNNYVLPASAGMIRSEDKTQSKTDSAPRIRGDDPVYRRGYDNGIWCSPHPRG